MVFMIIKILVIVGLGFGVLILIPDLFTPIASAIDSAIDTNLLLVLDNIYSVIPEKLMFILVLQLTTLIIIILIRFILGGKE